MRSAALVLAAWVSACASSSGPNRPVQIGFDRVPGWRTDATDAAFAQFRSECDRLGSLAPTAALGGGVTAAAFRPACLAARQLVAVDAGGARRFFERWFAAFDEGETMYAGYDEPEFPGSLSRVGVYRTPVLARPPDLVTLPSPDGHGTISGRRGLDGRLAPYPTRAEIDRGALDGRGLALVWLSDPVDLVFLQLSGSGRIRLPSGQVVRVAYAGKNGRPYVPLGRLMVERGLLAGDAATPASIRAWLESHPGESRALIEENPNYVFFRVLAGVALSRGAPGTLGVPLTPYRSVAVGRDVPLGAPVFVDAGSVRGLMLAQDSASDGETEIFLGWGAQATTTANALRRTGTLYVLLPRTVRDSA